MSLSKVKDQFKDKLVVFNGGGKKTLGEREDIDQLAILAIESKDRTLLELFETLPELEVLKKAKTDTELKAIPGETE